MHYHPEEQTLLIECSPGTIVVMGPKALEFCDRFCSHKAGVLKADGKDIMAVTMALRGERGQYRQQRRTKLKRRSVDVAN